MCRQMNARWQTRGTCVLGGSWWESRQWRQGVLCTCIFSKFEVNPKVIFKSPYFYQRANSKCRSDWISSLLTYCLLLMWSSTSCAWHTELVHIWSYFSPHFPTYGLHCCSSLPNPAATCLCLCTCCSLCLDYPFPWSLCKTPILLSKTICISLLLRSLLWYFLPWVNVVYTLCLSPWLHLSAEYSSALRSPKATLRMWGGALIFLGKVWIRWYILEHPTEAIYQVISPHSSFYCYWIWYLHGFIKSSAQVSGETKCCLVAWAVVSPGDLHLRSPPKFSQGVGRIQFTAAVGLKSLISAGWHSGVTLWSFHAPPSLALPGMAVCFIVFQDRSASQMYRLWKSGPLRIISFLTNLVHCLVTWPRE